MTNNKTNIISGLKYFTTTFLLLLVLTGAAILVLGANYFNWFPAIPCYFLISIVSFYFIMQRLQTVPGNKFFNYYMGVLFSKFFLAIIFIVFYLVFIKQQSAFFVITFFIYYLVFSVFETAILVKINKQAAGAK